MTGPQRFEVTLPIPGAGRGWINSNDRDNRFAQARKVRAVREAAGWATKAARLPQLDTPVTVHALAKKPTKRRFDGHNLTPTLKAFIDGMVDAKVLPDDSNAWVRSVTIDGVPNSRIDELVVIVTTVTVEAGCPACGCVCQAGILVPPGP